MELTELKYLDLALPKKEKEGNLIIERGFNIKCYFQQSNHVMHSNNLHMNTLVDLVISLGNNLEKFNGQMNKINTHIHSCIATRNKLLEELIVNIDYIRNQNNEIIGYLNNIKTLNKENNISILFGEIEKINKHYEKIKMLLEEIKHLSLI